MIFVLFAFICVHRRFLFSPASSPLVVFVVSSWFN